MLDPSYTDAPHEAGRLGVRVSDAPGRYDQAWLRPECDSETCRIDWDARQLAGEGIDHYHALMALQEELDGLSLRLACCGTCQNLRMTGMSQQMSRGRQGYCMLELRRRGIMTRDMVSIFGWCKAFAFGSQAFIRELDSVEAHRQRLAEEGRNTHE